MRTTERFEDGEWKEIDFKELKIGDKFKLYDGEEKKPVLGMFSKPEFICVRDPYINRDGILAVDIQSAK